MLFAGLSLRTQQALSFAAVKMTQTHLRTLELSFNRDEPEKSASRLVYALLPEWEHLPGQFELKTFTQGITNTVRGVNLRSIPSDRLFTCLLSIDDAGEEEAARSFRRADRTE